MVQIQKRRNDKHSFLMIQSAVYMCAKVLSVGHLSKTQYSATEVRCDITAGVKDVWNVIIAEVWS